jgi:hypothetical protein
MKHRLHPFRALTLLAIPLAAMALLSGCEHTTPSETPPDAEVAADFASSAQSAATVNENLELAELFASPMETATADLGFTEDTEYDPWTGAGVDFPQLALINAEGFRAAAALQASVALSARESRKATATLPEFTDDWGRAEGDTIDVEYFDNNNFTGLNAILEGAEPDMVRFVSIRDFLHPQPMHPEHTESELLIDTQGTLADNSDDEYHRLWVLETWANGQRAEGEILPASGSGPILPATLVVATHRIDDPMHRPLVEWIESEARLEAGELDVEGDEVMHRFMHTVHWRSGAENESVIEAVGGGAIVDGSEVTIVATHTAAPSNLWLESVVDTIRGNLGVLDDPMDDLLLEIGRVSTFDGVTALGDSPTATITFVPEEPVGVGEEPCGGEFTEAIYYAAGWWLQHSLRVLDINCDGSGSLHVHLDFLDGTSLDRTITWDAGVATLSEIRPNGISVQGTWNEATGEYSVVTTFPAGSDPMSREQTGTHQAGSVTGRDEFFWQDDHADYRTFTATRTAQGWNATGQRVLAQMTETFSLNGSEGLLEGEWSRTATGVNASGEYTLEALEAGGAHLVFSARDTLAEGNPSAEGDFWYAADGSGHGTVAYTQFGQTVTFQVQWNGDGEGHLADGQGNQIRLGQQHGHQ